MNETTHGREVARHESGDRALAEREATERAVAEREAAGPPPAERPSAAPALPEPRGSRGRNRWIAAGIVLVLAAGAVVAWRAGVFSAPASPAAAGPGAAPPATAVVTQQNIAATTPVTATLGYAGTYTVTGEVHGILTSLPSAGQVIRQGQVLYRTGNGSPVTLLYGSIPDWRAMSEGTSGQDVAQLNHDLVTLGYADRPDIVSLGWDFYSWETGNAVQLLEEHLGVSNPSENLALGEVAFEPQALRVSQVTGSLGGSATGPVLTATSDRYAVTIPLSTSQESEVAVGDAVTVTLPDNATTPGKISSIGAVASGSAGSATIPVTVTLTHPSAAGTVDQAPVTVNITTASARNVLAVPVTALVAQSPGGYAVEVVGRGSARSWVPVTPGIFDDDSGLVQVTGVLTPGERVVVAAS